MVLPVCQIVWHFQKKIKTEPLYNPKIPFLNIYSQRIESRISKTCFHTFIFTEAWFTIAKMWEQIICLSADKWIKKMCSIHTMEYYSVLKKKEILQYATTQMDLEVTMLSEISQSQTHIKWSFLYVVSKTGKCTDAGMVVAGTWEWGGGEKWGGNNTQHKVSVKKDE